ncbi:hypothetical protein ACS0TY_007663 [Phlomoides rotata]
MGYVILLRLPLSPMIRTLVRAPETADVDLRSGMCFAKERSLNHVVISTARSYRWSGRSHPSHHGCCSVQA